VKQFGQSIKIFLGAGGIAPYYCPHILMHGVGPSGNVSSVRNGGLNKV